MRNREWETLGRFLGRETVHLRENQPRRVGVAEEEEKRETRLSTGHGLGVSVKQEQNM